MSLKIDGVPAIENYDIEFHICNRRSQDAAVVQSTLEQDGKYSITIPNDILKDPDNIILYVCVTASGYVLETIEQVRIPVIPRPKPSDYNDTPSGVNGASNPEFTRVGTNSEVMGETVIFPETEAMTMRIQEDRLNLLKADKTDEIDAQEVLQ